MPFQIQALPYDSFAPLFALPDSPQATHHRASKKPGYPCRVSLQDAEIGEELILAHYEHQPAHTPFRASHAVYVRKDAVQAHPAPNEVPAQLRSRVLSLRSFNESGTMTDADLAEGTALEAALDCLFENPATAYIQIHFAKPGCYAARANRA